MGKIRLVAFDLDGTVLDSGNRASKGTIGTIRRLLDDGVEVASISGRSVSKSQLPFEGPGLSDAMHVGSYNGAVALRKVADGRRDVLLEQRMPEDLFRDAIHVVRREAWNVVYCDLTLADGQVREAYRTIRRDATIDFMTTQTATDFEVDAELLGRIARPGTPVPPKIIVLPGEERRDAVCRGLRERYGDRLYIAATDVDRIELMHPEVNKAVALERIAAACGTSPAETLAVGDGENDFPMLRAAGVGALMGNAPEGLRKRARGTGIVQVPGLESEGFCAAVERYVYGG